MKNRKIFYVVVLCLFVSLKQQVFSQSFKDKELNISLNELKLISAIDLIKTKYVDTVNENKLVETAIIEMLKGLDPHSSYLTAEEVKEMNEPLHGNFEGIGVSFNILNDTIFVINAIPGGPSEKLGILSGDKIIEIDQKNVAGIGITNKDVFSKLRGEKGTKVTVSIKRRNEKNLIDFTIIRDKIPIFSLDASYMINKETGYIKLNRFSETTGTEFDSAIFKLKSQHMQNLILDLTGNGGGYLDKAVYLANQFLEKGKMIVYTKGVHSEGVHSPNHAYISAGEGSFQSGKLVVLIDESSASASEILAGAIQDWDRGTIIGRRSFGKGLVQQQLELPDGSMLKLTIARYYTPTGRLIQKSYKEGVDEYEKDLANRYKHGELSNKDSIHFSDSLKYFTLVKKRLVYGGGGIMPDIFVALDTADNTEYFSSIIRKGTLNKFVLNYIDTHREELKRNYPVFSSFDKNFSIDNQILDDLVAFAKKEGISENKDQFQKSKKQIVNLLKAYIARDVWDTNEFFEIMNQDNPVILKALETLNQ